MFQIVDWFNSPFTKWHWRCK